MDSIKNVIQTVYAHTRYRVISCITFPVALLLYLITLPAMFTGGVIGLVGLRYLTLELIGVAFVMATLLTLIVPFSSYLLAQGFKARSGTTTSGVVIGLLAPLLCCTPIIPILLGVLATAFPFVSDLPPGVIQGFIATHETYFFLTAIALLLIALYQNAKRIAHGDACRLG